MAVMARRRNDGRANRKGHCGRERRGDTLLNLTPEEASRICMDQCRAWDSLVRMFPKDYYSRFAPEASK